jgi:hypothetical protein
MIVLIIIICSAALICFFVSTFLVEEDIWAEKQLDSGLYYEDYEELRKAITEVAHKHEIKLCCDAIYSFRLRYRNFFKNVEADTEYLIELLDKKLYELNCKKSYSLINFLN